MPKLAGRKVTVVGLGHFGGGVGVSRWLCGQGARVTVTDAAPADKLADSVAQLSDLDVTFHLGGHEEKDFTRADLLVVNPAVPKELPLLAAARQAGVPRTSEINLFIQRCPARIVGITGSVGKSTTTAMIGDILRRRFTTHVGGNIGGSLLESLDRISPSDVVVLELSSFQLEDLPLIAVSPHLAVVTNLKPNHLDRHGTLEAYGEAKKNIFRFQAKDDVLVLNADDPPTAAWASEAPGKVVFFTQNPSSISAQESGNPGKQETRRAWERDIDRANFRFNDGLRRFMDGSITRGDALYLGVPGELLRRSGLPDAPLLLHQRVLQDHLHGHGEIRAGDLVDLVLKINQPVAVFNSRTVEGAKVVLVDLVRGGKHVVVPIHIKVHGKSAYSEVASFHGRSKTELELMASREGELLLAEKTKGDWLLKLNRPLHSRGSSSQSPSTHIIVYSSQEIKQESQEKSELFDLLLPGAHNQANAQAAWTAARQLGVDRATAQEALREFKGLPHRLQFVCERGGVRYFNDSKCTTPEGAIVALESFEPRKVIQIVGGYDKHANFDAFGAALAARAKTVVALGVTKDQIVAAVEKARQDDEPNVINSQSFDAAVAAAKQSAAPGDVVLLSPACASWDMFTNYEKRGERFVELVNELRM